MRTYPQSYKTPEVLTIAPDYNQKKNYKKKDHTRWNPWFEPKSWWQKEQDKTMLPDQKAREVLLTNSFKS